MTGVIAGLVVFALLLSHWLVFWSGYRNGAKATHQAYEGLGKQLHARGVSYPVIIESMRAVGRET